MGACHSSFRVLAPTGGFLLSETSPISVYSTPPPTPTNPHTHPLSPPQSKNNLPHFPNPPPPHPPPHKFLRPPPQFPGRRLRTPHPRHRPPRHRHGHSQHASHRRRRRSRLRHVPRLPPLLLPGATNASRRHLFKLGLRRSSARGFLETCLRRAQPRHSPSTLHHRQLRLYSALS